VVDEADLAAVVRVRALANHFELAENIAAIETVCDLAEQSAKLREETNNTVSAANNRCLELDQERRSALRERDEARAECKRLRGELKAQARVSVAAVEFLQREVAELRAGKA